MPASNWFWIIYVIAVVFSGGVLWPWERKSSVWIVVFVLFGLLGYHVFHSPVQ